MVSSPTSSPEPLGLKSFGLRNLVMGFLERVALVFLGGLGSLYFLIIRPTVDSETSIPSSRASNSVSLFLP